MRSTGGPGSAQAGLQHHVEASRWIFDAAVVVAVASGIGELAVGDWEGSLRFTIIVVSMATARTSAVPVPFAAGFAVLLLPATWGSAQRWYRQIDHFDLIVHLFAPGAVAAVFYFILFSWRLLPPPGHAAPELRAGAAVLRVAWVGGTVALLWECYEWVIQKITPKTIVVGYSDSVSDRVRVRRRACGCLGQPEDRVPLEIRQRVTGL
jgi:hypothetical protein